MSRHTRMRLSDIAYIALRLVRRFCFTDRMLRQFGKWVPFYQVNRGETAPQEIANRYAAYAARQGADIAGRNILEIGVGPSNGTGYELLARGCARVYVWDPHVKFDPDLDARLLKTTLHRRPRIDPARLLRIDAPADIPDQAADMILSNSVLEHVDDFDALLYELKRMLRPDGCMIHMADYRDHFFKYPFHFLTFSRRTWEKWLNPGDLNRLRLTDHIHLFARHGFAADVIDIERDPVRFERIRPRIHPEFSRYPAEDLDVTFAALFVRRAP